MHGEITILCILCKHIEMQRGLESEEKFQKIGVALSWLAQPLHDCSLTDSVFELLILYQVLFFHGFHRH